jgi:hypothetical protein
MNTLYTKGKQALLDGSVAWTTSNIKVLLVDVASYTVNLTMHSTLSDVPSGARVATSPVLANRTAVDGIAEADDIVISAVTFAGTIDAMIVFDDTGNPATSKLLVYIDSDGSSVLPFTPNGGSVKIKWHSNGVFRL